MAVGVGVEGLSLKPMTRALGVGLGYGILAYFCLSISRFGAPVESIWLSNTVLVWALANTSRAQWPLLVACAAAGHVGAHMLTGDAIDFTLAFLVGDMSEGVLCGLLLGLRPRSLQFETRGGVFYFLLVCALIGPLTSACIAALGSWLIGQPMAPRDFGMWFCADALGMIVFLPILQSMGQGGWRVPAGKIAPIAGAIVLVIALSALAAWFSNVPTLRLLLMPLFVAIAFELGVAGVQICLGAHLIIWVALTLLGRPPTPWAEHDMRDYLLVVQLFLAIFSATFLPLAVVVEEKQRLTDTLSETLAETREAWGAILGAEAQYRLVADNVSETVLRVEPDGAILFASPACMTLLRGLRPFEGRNIYMLLHPQDENVVREKLGHCLEQGLLNLVNRWSWRIRGDDGDWTALDARVTLVSPGSPGNEEFIVVLAPPTPRNVLSP